jgi:hypothetical protein
VSAVRYVLARAAENGFFEAVVPAAQRFDPLLRGSIRKGARRAFAAASSATSVTDEGHVLRLAYLQCAGRLSTTPDDVEGVKTAFEAATTMDPKRGMAFWPASLVFLLTLLGVGIGVGVFLWWPSPRDRFAKTSLGEAMSDGLTDWVVGTGRRDQDRQEKGRNEIMSRGVKRQIGEGAFNLLGSALDQSKALAFATSTEDADREAVALESTLRSLDSELQTKKLPAFFDNYVDSSFTRFGEQSNVWLLGYYVEDRGTMTVGSNLVPVLRGRRLDNLNLQVGGKAYESKVLGGWVLSMDEVEQWVIGTVVPALGKDRPFSYGEKGEKEGSAGRLETKVGEKVRGELLARAGLEQDDATELADALSQRHSAFLRLAVMGDELYEPRGLRASPRLKKALKRRQDLEMDAREISRIEDRLTRFEKPMEKLVAVQASLDEVRITVDATCRKDDKCTFTADTDDLAKSMGGKTLLGRNAAAVASRLAMIAHADTPYLALAEAELGTGGYVTLFLIERELGLSPEWLSSWGVADAAEHCQLGVAVFDKPADVIKKAAESVYAKVYGGPMPAISRTPAPK